MSSWEDLVQDIEKANAANDLKTCDALFTKARESGITHPQLSWRYGRYFYQMAEEITDKAQREKYFREGLSWAQKAVQELPNDFAAQKWAGILLSGQGEFTSTKEKIANAYVIRDHFQKAVELMPSDANAQHCMGMWCWNVLQISWLERKAASLLFGTPPTSTYEDCLKYLLAADKAETTIHNSIAIGDVYRQQKQKEEALKWYQKALSIPAETEQQKRQRADAEQKIKF